MTTITVPSPWLWPGSDNRRCWMNTFLFLFYCHHQFFFLTSLPPFHAHVFDFEWWILHQSWESDDQKCSSEAVQHFQCESPPKLGNQMYTVNIILYFFPITLSGIKSNRNQSHFQEVMGSTMKIHCQVGGSRSR